MILIDSNVPMYLVGADHPHKDNTVRILDDLIVRGEPLVTDAEVFQEILHRYAAIDRLDAIQPAFDVLRDLADEILPVTGEDVVAAKDILLGRYGLSARDCIHLAIMRAHGIGRILSFDARYDRFPGIERLA